MSGYDHTGLGLGNVGFSWIMLDFEWNMLVYDHAGLGLENVGPDEKMLDLAG